MENKKALVYVSETKNAFSEEELNSLAAESAKSNAKHGITGYLFYDNKAFLQYFEGTSDKVDQLHQNIAKDSRHSLRFVIVDEPLKYFRFMAWNMRYLTLEDLRQISIEQLMIDTLRNNTTTSMANEETFRNRIWKMADVLSNNQWKFSK